MGLIDRVEGSVRRVSEAKRLSLISVGATGLLFYVYYLSCVSDGFTLGVIACYKAFGVSALGFGAAQG